MKNRNAFLAGLFIICCVILTIGVVIGVRGLSMEKRVVRIASFRLADNISGLREGDDVRIGGHRVGVVKKVRLEDGSDDKKVLVSFTIPASADIRKDAHIAIESSVTGVANLNIDDFGKGASLGENDQLVGAPQPTGGDPRRGEEAGAQS